MRKKILIIFILFVTVPVFLIYTVATIIFNRSVENNLTAIYTSDIKNISRIAENYLSESLELTMYPLIEPNLNRFYTEDSNSEGFADIEDNARTILSSSPYILGGIRSVTLVRKDGITLDAKNNYFYNSSISESDKYQSDKLNGSAYWDFGTISNHLSQFSITRTIKSKDNLSVNLGYIKTSISKYDLQANVQNALAEENSSYYILNSDNAVVSANPSKYDQKVTVEDLKYDELSILANKKQCSVFDGNCFISAQKIPKTPLIICSVIVPSLITSVKSTLTNVLLTVAILTMVFFTLLAFVLSKSIVRPMKDLGKKMQAISNEDFSVRVQVNGNDELSVLAKEFNFMGERLEFLYNQIYMGEVELNKSQMIALQSEINPHFLYNTMDTIYWMAKLGDTENVTKIVSSMSKLLRLSITPDNKNMISLEHELEHLNCYMQIQQVRYNNKIDFKLECDENLKTMTVLKLLLQPLVENALSHGLGKLEHGELIVCIHADGNDLIYEVKNDGEPIDCEQISDILSAKTSEIKGLAIRNIDRRLRLKYGETYGLAYYIEGKFSVFKIRQPMTEL